MVSIREHRCDFYIYSNIQLVSGSIDDSAHNIDVFVFLTERNVGTGICISVYRLNNPQKCPSRSRLIKMEPIDCHNLFQQMFIQKVNKITLYLLLICMALLHICYFQIPINFDFDLWHPILLNYVDLKFHGIFEPQVRLSVGLIVEGIGHERHTYFYLIFVKHGF